MESLVLGISAGMGSRSLGSIGTSAGFGDVVGGGWWVVDGLPLSDKQ